MPDYGSGHIWIASYRSKPPTSDYICHATRNSQCGTSGIKLASGSCCKQPALPKSCTAYRSPRWEATGQGPWVLQRHRRMQATTTDVVPTRYNDGGAWLTKAARAFCVPIHVLTACTLESLAGNTSYFITVHDRSCARCLYSSCTNISQHDLSMSISKLHISSSLVFLPHE